MTSLLLAWLVVLVVPLFVATWRSSLVGLSLQGFLLVAMALRQDLAVSQEMALSLLDLGIVRGAVVPLVLYRVLAGRKVAARNDLLPPNLLAWAGLVGVLLMAFRLADLLVPAGEELNLLVASVGCAVAIGFLVLSTQSGVFSQIVGVLRLENGIALLELGLHHPGGFALHLGQLVVFVATVLLLRGHLEALPEPVTGGEP